MEGVLILRAPETGLGSFRGPELFCLLLALFLWCPVGTTPGTLDPSLSRGPASVTSECVGQNVNSRIIYPWNLHSSLTCLIKKKTHICSDWHLFS